MAFEFEYGVDMEKQIETVDPKTPSKKLIEKDSSVFSTQNITYIILRCQRLIIRTDNIYISDLRAMKVVR